MSLFLYSGALLTVGEGARKGHTKSASISAASQHSEMTPLDTNIDVALRARLVLRRVSRKDLTKYWSYEIKYCVFGTFFVAHCYKTRSNYNVVSFKF